MYGLNRYINVVHYYKMVEAHHLLVNMGLKITCMQCSICRCESPFSNLIHCKYSELKQVTSAVVWCSEVELCLIHIAVGGE